MKSALLALCLAAANLSLPASADPGPAPELVKAAERVQAEAGTHRLILLGEMHGTRETPRMVAALAARYAQEGPVLVGLELPETLAPAISSYLDSSGDAAARAALLAPSEWHVPHATSDGRRNLEVIALFEQLRVLKAQGREVSVLPFDNPPGTSRGSQARDQAMAARIRAAYAALPRGRLLAVAGNVHAMLRKPDPMFAPPELQDPMGCYLLDLQPFSVNIQSSGGEFWAFDGSKCGPAPQTPVSFPSVRMQDQPWDFLLVLPPTTIAEFIPE